jgi:ubiquitin carboxyl-terminal hydrolase L5
MYGAILLFKWKAEKDHRKVEVDYPKDLFFAKQVIQDACATQALLGILMNITSDRVDLGQHLNDFKSFTSLFSPEDKGAAIGDHSVIRNAHNSFSEPELFIIDERDKDKGEKGDAFHFISYVPFQGVLYEIDGLKAGPYKICDYSTESEWKEKLLIEINKRTSTYTENDFFACMAMVPDKIEAWEREINELKSGKMTLDVENQIKELQYEIKLHKEGYIKIEKENVRRRHYYVPFLVNLLKVLSEKNELIPLLKTATSEKK